LVQELFQLCSAPCLVFAGVTRVPPQAMAAFLCPLAIVSSLAVATLLQGCGEDGAGHLRIGPGSSPSPAPTVGECKHYAGEAGIVVRLACADNSTELVEREQTVSLEYLLLGGDVQWASLMYGGSIFQTASPSAAQTYSGDVWLLALERVSGDNLSETTYAVVQNKPGNFELQLTQDGAETPACTEGGSPTGVDFLYLYFLAFSDTGSAASCSADSASALPPPTPAPPAAAPGPAEAASSCDAWPTQSVYGCAGGEYQQLSTSTDTSSCRSLCEAQSAGAGPFCCYMREQNDIGCWIQQGGATSNDASDNGLAIMCQ